MNRMGLSRIDDAWPNDEYTEFEDMLDENMNLEDLLEKLIKRDEEKYE